jgi:hypothetical protein
MRGFLFGAILIFIVIVSALSLRPGGLRNQLRNMARRLKLALILGGVYAVVSAGIRLALPGSTAGEWGTVGAGLVLAIAFVFLSAERPLRH